MCKLCNTDSIYVLHKKTNKAKRVPSQKISLFVSVVRDYTGEEPCSKCRITFNSFKGNLTIDEWVQKRFIQKLFGEDYKKVARRMKTLETVKYRKVKKKTNFKRISVELYISKIMYSKTSSYKFNKSPNEKSFKTLKEAQQYKKEILCQQQVN